MVKRKMKKVIFFLLVWGSVNTTSADEMSNDAFEMSLQDLLNTEVTSVSREAVLLSDAPAAIYVVTADDIKKSGATSIPQALRGVPGLHVAQIDSQKWAVSSRGFNGRYNNKLLVMIDGRSVYSPEFSGVYWEVQDYLMNDILRIEVIRGPSSAMWGANAVNGVINIITKHSADTQGGYLEVGAGNYEQVFGGFRYGGKLSDNISARLYAKGFERDDLDHYSNDSEGLHQALMGVDTDNGWTHYQAGGRLDVQFENAADLAISFDAYSSRMKQIYHVPNLIAPMYRASASDDFKHEGWNILSNYKHALSATSEFIVKLYYDYTNREESLLGFHSHTFDLDFQHQFMLGERHNIAWGLGYRFFYDAINTHPNIVSTVKEERTDLWSAFVRDEITLVKNALWMTMALRFEYHTYSKEEWQPNVRLMWKVNDQHRLWGSIAYAVRTPSRVENNIDFHNHTLPPFELNPLLSLPVRIFVDGNEQFDSERLLSYELGWRFMPHHNLAFDTAFFYNDYDNLRGGFDFNISGGSLSHIDIQVPFINDQKGHNYGFDVSTQWRPHESLKLNVNYGFIQSHFDGLQTQNTYAPKHIISLQGDWAITDDISLNARWRYVDYSKVIDAVSRVDKTIDGYQGVDVGMSWRASPNLRLSAYGKNLFENSHVEYEAEQFNVPFRVEPSFYGKVELEF